MLDRITLVIATKNRHQYLERVIDYYSNSGINILIADATREKYTKQLPPNFSYSHYPEIHFSTKLDDVFKKINTTYSMLCADDDFIIPEAIEESVRFLEANPDYASAQGYYLGCNYSKNKLFYSLAYRSSIGCDINNESARGRLEKFNEIDIQFFYCVHKTESLQDIFGYASHKLYNLNLLDLFIGYSTLIKGKHKVLPIFYSVREVISGSAGRSDGLDITSVSPKYKDQYNAFFSEIVRKLCDRDDISVDEASVFFNRCVKNYIDKYFSGGFSLKQYSVSLLEHKIIPLAIRKRLQHFFLLRQQEKQQQRIDELEKLTGTSLADPSNQEKLRRIESYIFKYNILS